jgi:hypothetical protein
MPVPRDDDALDEEQEEELFLDEEEEFPEEELELEEESEPTEEGGGRRGPSPTRAVDVSEEDFRAKLATVDASTATPYVMRGDYSAGELVLHPQFGVGIVAAIVGPKKMQVIFQESSKLLVMNYAPPR